MSPALFSPLRVGNKVARNRLFVPPMCQYTLENRDGVANYETAQHYGALARGGWGAIIVEATAVAPAGRITPWDLGLWNEQQVQALEPIVADIKAHGALAGIQLSHAGRKASTYRWNQGSGTIPADQGGWQPLAPSELALAGHARPQALSESEIEQIIAAFAKAAKVASEIASLQVLAGKAFSYDPQTVLDTAQKLYEKKLTTYPRSDCEYLPPNQYGDRNAILNNLQNAGDEKLAQWATDADRSIKSRAWNEKKITAHHAIIPTTVACNMNSLSREERNIYFLISQAYIAQFYGEHVYEQTKIVVEQCEEDFVANGRVVIDEGWKLLYKRQKSKSVTDNDEPDLTDERGAETDTKKEAIEETDHLPAVKKKDSVLYTDSSVEAKQTKPPSRFTPSTLLQAMKEIHKFVKNEDLKKQLKAVSGIGTEATRANIIDELISRGFMKTSGKKQVLSPTETGYLLVDALPDELLYPDETAVWEERLALMSEGEDTLDSFLSDQVKFLQLLIDKLGFDKQVNSGQMMPNVVRTITNQNRKRPMDNTDVDLSSLPVCPKCNKGRMQQRNGKFGAFLGCTNYPACKHTQPVEGDTSKGESNITVSDEDKQYKCPRCKEGYFVKQEVRGRINWICSNRSQCKTQCSDVNGVPSIYANK